MLNIYILIAINTLKPWLILAEYHLDQLQQVDPDTLAQMIVDKFIPSNRLERHLLRRLGVTPSGWVYDF